MLGSGSIGGAAGTEGGCRSVVPSKAPLLGAPGAAWHLMEASAGCLVFIWSKAGRSGASGYEYLIVIQLWVLAAGGKV